MHREKKGKTDKEQIIGILKEFPDEAINAALEDMGKPVGEFLKMPPVKPDDEPGTGIWYRVLYSTPESSACQSYVAPGATSLIELHLRSTMTYGVPGKEAQAVPDGVVMAYTAGNPKSGALAEVPLEKYQPRSARPDGTVVVAPGEIYYIRNPYRYVLNLWNTETPAWNTDSVFYKSPKGKTLLSGVDVWFEIRESPFKGKRGLEWRIVKYVPERTALESIRLASRVESLVERCEKSRISLTGMKGRGIVELDGVPTEVHSGKTLTIEPRVKFQLKNPSKDLWELTRYSKPEWNPADSFYQIGREFVPGTKVWFTYHLA